MIISSKWQVLRRCSFSFPLKYVHGVKATCIIRDFQNQRTLVLDTSAAFILFFLIVMALIFFIATCDMYMKRLFSDELR